MNDVIVFTNGDSSKISTWSNVPYCFTETLMRKGVTVHRVDIGPDTGLAKRFNRHLLPWVKRLFPDTTYDYFRSRVHHFDVQRRIRRAVKAHPSVMHHIFLTFSFNSVGTGDATRILFGDWTYDHHIKYFMNRSPDWFESKSIRREDSSIRSADLVFPLFPKVAGYMKERYRHPRIHYLGNVVNSVVDPGDVESAILRRQGSYKILFIGKPKYKEGAIELIRAFQLLKSSVPDVRLDIIGMKKEHFGDLPEGIRCHGYLDKGKDEERELYYRLLGEAQVFVNTNPKWSGFSSSLEALYHYLPVVVSPYDEFTETFPGDIAFGKYCTENQAERIAEAIDSIFRSGDYAEMCRAAGRAAEPYSWDSYIGKLLREVADFDRSANPVD